MTEARVLPGGGCERALGPGRDLDLPQKGGVQGPQLVPGVRPRAYPSRTAEAISPCEACSPHGHREGSHALCPTGQPWTARHPRVGPGEALYNGTVEARHDLLQLSVPWQSAPEEV